MSRTTFIRWQLVVLVLLALLVGLRACQRRAHPAGEVVVFADMAPGALYHRVLVVARPVRLVLEGVGARSGEGQEAAPAAYGWLLRTADRHVVWQMQPPPGTESLRFRVRDTLRLAPGRYDVFFTTQGDVSRRTGFWAWLSPEAPWARSRRDWTLRFQVLDDVAALRLEDDRPLPPGGPALLWTAAPMPSAMARMVLLEVQAPTRVRLYAVGEFDPEPADYGWIEQLPEGRRVWEMTYAQTRPAGGWHGNRQVLDTLTLAPGLYRAWFQTDDAHAFGNWRFNPPLDPAAWGLTLWRMHPEDTSVALFDPWERLQPVLQLTAVGNDENRRADFVAADSVSVLLYALGELGTRNRRYDYAWLTDSTGAVVWEMRRSHSVPAGGHPNNRLEIAALVLGPGRYTLHYRTDDSHAYGDWRNGQPEHPERWGVTLFVLAPGPEALHLLDEAAPPTSESPPTTTVAPLPAGRVLVDLTRVGNNEHRVQAFTLDRPTRLRIRAVGELSISGRYDYGWIERTGTGEVVWEMTWEHTRPAGGDARNRLADTTLTLPPGSYTAHFRTDFSHAYGQFEYPAPDEPEAWGLRIERLNQ
ncbi:hypothetical protein [Rhodothermus marinus]|uniref:hypothetical protein n=1 Tax=Rhodothermus marinus TaxID=29549 RepID=UPI0012BA456F|nr:hypothetical protein [Rhodothermus marinus]BBM70643.1 hypothetical protein RmaAA213_24890 [Rhodothermus marinus]BBM73629.1 hypothetical protein RmaAA338_24940 [Rhodothermus marinus]